MSRRGKKKAKTLTLSEFMGADESPQAPPHPQYRGPRRDFEVVLPQGPRASLAVDVDLSRLPSAPPFFLLISNLSYESEENNLRAHLGNIKGLVEVVWNYKDERKDGTAFLEFETRDGAVAALKETDTVFGGRKIVINVAEVVDGKPVKESSWRNRDGGNRWEHDKYPQRGGWRDSGFRSRYSRDDSAEPGDDWRTREHSRDSSFGNRDHHRDGSYGNRDYHRDGSYGNRDYSREGGYGNREFGYRERRDNSDKDSWRSLDRDGDGDRFPSGQRNRGRGGRAYSPRRSSPSDQSPERSRWTHTRGRDDRIGRGGDGGRRPWRGQGDGSYRRTYDREVSDDSDSWRRPAHNFSEQERGSRSSSPPPPPLHDKEASNTGPSIFGGARPVDTASREREMEEKMSRMSTLSPVSSDSSRALRRPQGGFPGDRDRDRDRDRGQEEFRRPRGERNENRSFGGDRNENRSFGGDRREYRSGRDRRGQYRGNEYAEGDRGPRRAPDDRRERPAPRAVFKEQEQVEFAKNTRFSLLESEETND